MITPDEMARIVLRADYASKAPDDKEASYEWRRNYATDVLALIEELVEVKKQRDEALRVVALT